MKLVQEHYQIQIMPVAIYLLIFKARMNMFIHYQSEVSFSHQMVI